MTERAKSAQTMTDQTRSERTTPAPREARRLAGWPNRESSRFVRAGGLLWHVQVMGAGPVLLLLHGTAAATHSWRDLAPALAPHFTVVAPDLPGHGFTQSVADRRMSLPGMAAAVHALLRAMELRPALAAGHSAGAAVLAHMCLHNQLAPRGLVALNGAFLPMGGVPGQLFSPLAKFLTGLPGLPTLFAWRARNPSVVRRLLADTGSRLDPAGIALYARLIQTPAHAAAALAMMAHWDLDPLAAALPRLTTPLLLLTGANDRAVPPAQSESVRALVPTARLLTLPNLGHLAHEEDPTTTAHHILTFAHQTAALAPTPP